MILVSIIVPVYKIQEIYLKKCLTSIIKQTYSNLEILIIDDGSFDKCTEICDNYACKDKRIQVIHQNNQGVSSARNLGIEISQGEYICFVDADDYIGSHYIERLLKYKGNSDIVCTGHTKQFLYNQEIHSAFNNSFKYSMDVIGTVWGKLYRREIIGEKRFDSQLSHCEDVEFNFRVFEAASYKYLDIFDYYYRYHFTSTVRQFNVDTIQNYFKTISKISQSVLNNDQKKAYYTFVCTVFRVIIENNIYYKDKSFFAKIKEIKVLVNDKYFYEAIHNVDFTQLSKTRRLPILAVKCKWYGFAYLIICIRRFQYKLYNRGGR